MTKASPLVLDSIFYSVPELTILQGAYLKVNPGSICGLIGLNGSGKSTLLKVAAGQIEADSGIMIVGNERIASVDRRARFKYVSYLQQESMLPSDLTVERLLGYCDRNDLKTHESFERLVKTRIRDLSGGEKRYLELQLILGLDRPFVLLDEPFTGVEPRIIEQISVDIAEAASTGTGFLLTDHYTQYMLPLIDDAYLIRSKNCLHLQGDDIRSQLVETGYLRA